MLNKVGLDKRPAGLGYDWHNVMHMVMGAVSAFLHQAMTGKVPFGMRVHGDGQARLPVAHTV